MEIGVIVLVVIIILVLVIGASKQKPTRGSIEIRKHLNLFTDAERSFLGVLESCLSRDHRVFGKVRVADTMKVSGAASPRQIMQNKINQKHFDFLICRADTLAIVGAIELNDKSHESTKRKARDQFLADVCAQAGIPLIAIEAKRNYQPEIIKQLLREKLELGLVEPLKDSL